MTMDELFSCRNCIHNCVQSLHIGQGAGYCLKHNSVIVQPGETTCKYLHRKDLPQFIVGEGVREHAAEFALFSGLVSLRTRQALERIRYSERFAWEHRAFDPLVNAIAQYYKIRPHWAFIQGFTGGTDGRRSLTYAAFVRRYMDTCETWRSSYRLVLGLVDEIDEEPQFDPRSVYVSAGEDMQAARTDALWDVVFTRLAGLQEYGYHAGLESVMWATDSLDGGLAELNWPALRRELSSMRQVWIDQILSHAQQQDVFFPQPEDQEAELESD
jgi:hypothetical protein